MTRKAEQKKEALYLTVTFARKTDPGCALEIDPPGIARPF
jgi:hypothetical protein